MAWIESHTELARHPKTRRFSRHLGISIPAAIGHLHLLWYWALEFAQSGDLSGYDNAEIASECLWEGDPALLREALTASGFLDACGTIHDWDDYAGRLIERRQQAIERTRSWRQSRKAATGDPDTHNVQSPTDDVMHNVRVRYAPTVPNRTVPNQTIILPTSSEGGPTLDSGPISRPRTRKRPEAESPTAKPANRGKPLTPLQEVVEAYLTAVGRNAARVQNWGRYGAALCELQGVPPAEVAHCTAWLASDPYYRDQARPPPPEQVTERYPGWVALGRPDRWKPPPKRNGRVTMADTVAAINNGTLDLNQPLERIAPDGEWTQPRPLEGRARATLRLLSAP